MMCIRSFKMMGYKNQQKASQTEPPHHKTNKVTMCPAKTQISLGIRSLLKLQPSCFGACPWLWMSCSFFFFFWKLKKIIRIFHGCEVRIEKSIRVMPNSDPEGRFITTELRDVLYTCTTSVLKPHFYSFFIYPTGRIRICKIWFVSSTGENRGKHCLVSKKICSSPSRPILCCRYWSPLTGFYLVVF